MRTILLNQGKGPHQEDQDPHLLTPGPSKISPD
jgi:hypothetical protein